jgi:hypothetical protein
MFQTSLINLSYHSHLLSISFVMNVTDIYRSHVVILDLRGLDHLSLSSLVKLIHIRVFRPNLPWCGCFLLLLMSDLLLFP